MKTNRYLVSAAALASLLIYPQAMRAQERYRDVVEGILAAWKTADVVCLGENHGRQYDSDLRIAQPTTKSCRLTNVAADGRGQVLRLFEMKSESPAAELRR
jgi:hypothetical protein